MYHDTTDYGRSICRLYVPKPGVIYLQASAYKCLKFRTASLNNATKISESPGFGTGFKITFEQLSKRISI